jgi:putative ABC transport system permease protein
VIRLVTRLSLLLVPARFRRRHRAEMVRLIEDMRGETAYRGVAGTGRLCRVVIADLAGTGRRLRAQDRLARRAARATAHVHRFPSRPRRLLEPLLNEFRQAVKLFVTRPGYAWPAAFTIAVGIGGASLVGGLIDGLVLRPFAYPDPDRLVSVGVTFPKVSDRERVIEAISPLEAEDIGRLRSLDRVIAFDLGNRNISGGDMPERVFTALLLGDPFRTLGMRPAIGRGFTDDELGPGGRTAAIISHRTWTSRFGGDSSILGRAIAVNGQPTPVVGVMPPNLLLMGTDLWLPLAAGPADWPRSARQFTVLARLSAGSTLEQANAELATMAGRIARDHGREFREYDGWRLSAAPWADVLAGRMKPAALLLTAATGCLLLFVCANVSSLQITRLSTRQRELAVRMALGASRGRVARELLVESLVPGLVGGALGLTLAAWGLEASIALLPAQLTTLGVEPSFSKRVFLSGLFLSLVSAMLVAVLPAMLLGRIGSGDALKADARGASPSERPHRLRQGLVVLELAVALVLLVGAGLMAHSMTMLQQQDPGIDVDRVLTMRVTLPQEKYQGPAITGFFTRLVDKLESTPGVVRAAAMSQFPPNVFGSTRFTLPGAPAANGELPSADWTIVTPGAFEALGIPLRQGRLLTSGDRSGSVRVVVVNESFARRYFPGQAAVGRRILGEGDGAPTWEIVGVVGDTRGRGVTSPPEPELYMTVEQGPVQWNQHFLVIRTAGEPTALLPSVRRVVAELDPQQPIYAIQTLEQAFSASTLQHRAATIVLLVFAGLAALLAAGGVYAVTAQSVAARRTEIGIRMALGAAGSRVSRMIVGQTLRLLAIGAVIGLVGGVAIGRLASSLLFGTSPTDPRILAGVTAALLLFGAVACWLPARRASRIDPAIALRDE